METRYGFSKEIFYIIIDVFKKYSDVIEKVLLFGSRARGDFKKTSDIDIAIKFKKNPEKISNIIEDMEASNIIYTMDIIDYDKISNDKLKSYVDSEGEIIFLSDDEGGVLLTTNKLEDKLRDLKKAFSKLKERSGSPTMPVSPSSSRCAAVCNTTSPPSSPWGSPTHPCRGPASAW